MYSRRDNYRNNNSYGNGGGFNSHSWDNVNGRDPFKSNNTWGQSPPRAKEETTSKGNVDQNWPYPNAFTSSVPMKAERPKSPEQMEVEDMDIEVEQEEAQQQPHHHQALPMQGHQSGEAQPMSVSVSVEEQRHLHFSKKNAEKRKKKREKKRQEKREAKLDEMYELLVRLQAPAAAPSASPAGPQLIPDDELKTGFWCSVGLCVLVRNYPFRIEGIIRSMEDGECCVYFENLDVDHRIKFEHLLPVKPTENDPAKVIYGNHKGMVGTMISVEGEEGIMQLTNGPVLLFSLPILCKQQS